ncbi:PREDICTED: DUF724 domain-containing protein 7-like isoform X2 [Tarenaya hassleriana]|uniref:DUF724 domain-containing protein 7-like isoform X2 n=1 Tax=Tarenaya hassleriana TaxID=28532 RepID=UPI00053CA49B|nr:PREDICTED: DUF724 domain-containing protein 7-like isoform X2 [Tarenaya hassleriana]
MLRDTELTKCGIAKGSTVEVSSDEDGFKGSLYVAVLEETPSKSKRKKLSVRYSTLLADDDFTPLRETVDPRFIRPVPPADIVAAVEKFEEGDVVDASYRDGWWTGVVMKILEGGRYVIYFDNPPDVIEFEGKDLRAHFDWIHGNWTRIEKQQLKKSAFSCGTTVEMRPDSEDLCDFWIPAVIIKENEGGTFHVKHKSLTKGVDAESMILSVVDSRCIRPTPMPCKDREYALLELVDVCHVRGWREGVITRVLAGKTYTVFFKSTNESFDFNHSDLRPSLEWKDGSWQMEPKLSIPLPDLPPQSGHINENADNSEQVVEPERIQSAAQSKTKRRRTPSKCLKKKRGDGSIVVIESYAVSSAKKMKLRRCSTEFYNGGCDGEGEASVFTNRAKNVQNTTPVDEQAHHGLSTPRTTSTSRAMANSETSIESEALISKVAARKKLQVTRQSGGKMANAVTNGKSPDKVQRATTATKEIDSPVVIGIRAALGNKTEATPGGKTSPKKTPQTKRKEKGSTNDSERVETEEQINSSNNIQKRKRGRPRKITSPEFCQTDQNTSDEKTVEASGDTEAATEDSNNAVTDDDQCLNTLIATLVGVNSSSAAEKLRLSSSAANNSPVENQIGLVETPMKDAAIVLPFVKRSPIWETVEGMEVFKTVPQRPHFSPLLETREEYREGSAIGMMVTFSRLLEKVNELQLDEPRSTLESINQCLLDVEKHGFDVASPLCRINELMSIKDKQIETLDRLKELKRELEECDKKRSKCEEDIEVVRVKFLELQSQQAGLMKLKESMDNDRARLQSQEAVLDQTIQNVEHEFQKTVHAPWNTNLK